MSKPFPAGVAVLAAAVLTALCAPPAARAQAGARPAGGAAEDGKSIESVTRALYESVSGPAGEKHDWTRFRGLFLAGAHIAGIAPDRSGQESARVQTVDDFLAAATPNLEGRGFQEREVGRREVRYGDIAHVWSVYETQHGTGAHALVIRGINSLQLAFADGRW